MLQTNFAPFFFFLFSVSAKSIRFVSCLLHKLLVWSLKSDLMWFWIFTVDVELNVSVVDTRVVILQKWVPGSSDLSCCIYTYRRENS